MVDEKVICYHHTSYLYNMIFTVEKCVQMLLHFQHTETQRLNEPGHRCVIRIIPNPWRLFFWCQQIGQHRNTITQFSSDTGEVFHRVLWQCYRFYRQFLEIIFSFEIPDACFDFQPLHFVAEPCTYLYNAIELQKQIGRMTGRLIDQ